MKRGGEEDKGYGNNSSNMSRRGPCGEGGGEKMEERKDEVKRLS